MNSRLSFLVTATALLLGLPARADSVNSTKISLPKGPGSIEGLGTAEVSPSLASGTATYNVPIAVPPGAAGFGPALSLAYDSGGGATEVGIGWRIAGTPKLRRRTENGLPKFDASDAFEVDGLGIPCDLLEMSPGVFRPEYEDGAFVRVERSDDGNTWELRAKSGVTYRFGGDAFTESEGARTSAYLLSEQVDRHDHRVAYEWDTSEGHALLTRVVWNDFDGASRNEILFDYELRPDKIQRFATGIRETLMRRLAHVRVQHGGALVRRLDLAYGTGSHPALASITLVGNDGTSALPAAHFDYTAPSLVASADQIVTMTNAPGVSPASPDAALVDLDGDGLPDFLLGQAGHYRSYRNHDGKHWLSPEDWSAASSPSVSLGATGVQLADLDADGAADLVVKSGTASFRYFPHPTGTRFDSPVEIPTVPGFTFEDPDVRLADLDGDRRTDVVVTTPSGIAVAYNEAGRDFTEPAIVGRVDPSQDLRFSDGHTELCDVNGDRVIDFCRLRSGALTYWLGRGRGVFQPPAEATGVPTFDVTAPFRLEDLNGDGWLDLVRVDVNRVSYALATAEGAFGSVQYIEGTPTKGPSTSVQFADMNGSGTIDVVWVDVTGTESASWKYLELFPDGRAGLLRRIDNGVGKVQTIDYAPAALDAAHARDAGVPWPTRMNVAMPVPVRVTVDASLGDPERVTEYSYRDGAYDPRERLFAGFGGGIERRLGDGFTPTLVTETDFNPGLDERVLRGAVKTVETRTDTGAVFSRITNTYQTTTLATATDGRTVDYAFESAERVDHVEGLDASKTRTTLTEFVQDDFGNVTEERHWGEVSGSDFLIGDDESLVIRTFANDAEQWLLGFLTAEEAANAQGNRVGFTRKYYDGAPFQGLPLGQVSRGDVSREEAWVGPGDGAFELVLGTKYNADGEPVETTDARGGGHVFEWAPDHTALVAEHVKLEGGRELVETADVDGAFGELLAAREYNGQETKYGYDAFGRLTSVVRPGDTASAPTVTYSYVAAAPLSRVITETRVTSETDGAASTGSGEPAGATSGTERSETLLDGLGRTRGTLTRDGARWVLAGTALLDARGNTRRALLPRWVTAAAHGAPPVLDDTPHGTDTFHDALGREVRTRSPSGIEARTEFAPLEVRHWDGGQNDPASPYEHTPTVEQKDGLGRVVSHVKTLSGSLLTATYTYDAAGNLLTRTDPEGAAARYAYDGRGRRITVVDPDLGEHHFGYDATSNLVSHAYPDGKTARFTFDLAGRSLTEDHDGDGSPEVSRTWDVAPEAPQSLSARGKLVRVAEPSGETRHTYDARGRITNTTLTLDGTSYSVKSAFDDQDREVLHTYPDGSSIAIRRNPRGQVDGYGNAVSIDYGEDGLETERHFNTGVQIDSGYDDDRRRSDLTARASDGAELERLHFSYDSAGNLAGVKDEHGRGDTATDRTESYTYDNLYRLTGVAGAWGTESWRYSPSGSLVSRTSSVPGQTLEHLLYAGLPHAPSSIDGRPVVVDARGRMTDDGSRKYTWNEADELVAVSNANASEENTYDAQGTRRTRVEHPTSGPDHTTVFIDDWSELSDGKLVRYIPHAGQRIVRLADTNGTSAAPFVAKVSGRSGREDGSLGLAWSLLLVPFVVGSLRRRKWGAQRRGLALPDTDSRSSRGPLSSRLDADAPESIRVDTISRLFLLEVALAVVVASANPAETAVTLTLLASLTSVAGRAITRRLSRSASAARTATGALFAAVFAVLALGMVACGGDHEPSRQTTEAPRGSVQVLTEADTLLVTDLLGSVLQQTTGSGKSIGRFSAYPFGATRFDTADVTRKYAAAPRDGGVGLDAMGARSYAPDLGLWTSGDPLAVAAPERLVTADFAAANPYAYAKDSPLLHADHDGHFWEIAVGAAVGALMGGAIEAARQYITTGKIEDRGRIAAAAIGGAVSGAILAANPVVAFTSTLGVGAASGGAAGLAERLVASGGRSAGTLKQFVTDAAVGAVTAGVLRGVAAVARRALGSIPTPHGEAFSLQRSPRSKGGRAPRAALRCGELVRWGAAPLGKLSFGRWNTPRRPASPASMESLPKTYRTSISLNRPRCALARPS